MKKYCNNTKTCRKKIINEKDISCKNECDVCS